MAAEQNSSDATPQPEEADTIELWLSPEDKLLLEHAQQESVDAPAPHGAGVTTTLDGDTSSTAGDSALATDTLTPLAAPFSSRGAAPDPAAFAALPLAAPRSSRFLKWTRTRTAWQKLRQKPRGVSTAIDLAIVITLIGLAYLMQYWLATPTGPPPLARRLTAAQVGIPSASARTVQAQAPPQEALPVYFRNPFDATEVFEFPPGTSQAEARDAVADLLLKRARERLSALDRLRETPPPHRQGIPAMTAQNSADPPE